MTSHLIINKIYSVISNFRKYTVKKLTPVRYQLLITQAKKFLKGDWLKRVVFQPNLKYLHVSISMVPTDTVVFWFWKHGGKVWMPFTWILSQCPHFTVKVSTYPSGFGCIIYCNKCLAGENGQRMKLVALWVNSRVHTCKLSNFDRRKSKHLNGFLCIHFGLVLLKGFLNERECCLLEFCRNVHISQMKVSWWKWLKMVLLKREFSQPCIINK